jgi:hypothetical protein
LKACRVDLRDFAAWQRYGLIKGAKKKIKTFLIKFWLKKARLNHNMIKFEKAVKAILPEALKK